ncbi:MAG TPA: hypothetical protein VF727_15375 [Allosphingosinicella sp.]
MAEEAGTHRDGHAVDRSSAGVGVDFLHIGGLVFGDPAQELDRGLRPEQELTRDELGYLAAHPQPPEALELPLLRAAVRAQGRREALELEQLPVQQPLHRQGHLREHR